MPRATSQSENHSCLWIKLPDKPSTKKRRIRFGKALSKWGLRTVWNGTPSCGSSCACSNHRGQRAKAGGSSSPTACPAPSTSVCAQGQDTTHILLRQRCWKWIQKKIQAPHILLISFHYKTPQLKGSSDLPPGFSSWGFQAWSGSCPTSPSARLRHRHFSKLVVFHSTSTAEFLQHLQLLQGPAKIHLYLFRKRIHWQSSILQSSSQGPGMLCRTLKCSRIAHSHVSLVFSSEWWPK